MEAGPSLIGRVLDRRYRVVRALGEGGMGAVYEAVQDNIGRRVAIKVLADDLRGEAAYIERFRREAEAAGRLMHPHIVQVTDFVQVPGDPPFLVMELLEGESLLPVLQRGRLAPGRACRIAVQLLSALAVAHDAGIVHRDLKPANVFLVTLAGGIECVKLLDFGIAKLKESDGYSRLTQTGVLIGTPRYAAPEQLASRPVIDARTDLYSAGVLLYGMLAGRPPFTSSGAQLLIDIQDREPPDLSAVDASLPPGLVAVVRRAMQKRPSERFASAREMSQALEPFTRDEAAPSAAPVTHADESTRASRPRVHAAATATAPARPAAAPARPAAAPAPVMLPALPAEATIPPTAPAMVGWTAADVARASSTPSAAPADAGRAGSTPPTVAMTAWASRPSAAAPPPMPAQSRDWTRWVLVLGAIGFFLVAVAAATGLLLFSARDRGAAAASPPASRAEEPVALPPQLANLASPVSPAAHALGPDCEAYETMVCRCQHPNAIRWCSRARAANEEAIAANDLATSERALTFCRESLASMRQFCP